MRFMGPRQILAISFYGFISCLLFLCSCGQTGSDDSGDSKRAVSIDAILPNCSTMPSPVPYPGDSFNCQE